jgi:hypothetical protein
MGQVLWRSVRPIYSPAWKFYRQETLNIKELIFSSKYQTEPNSLDATNSNILKPLTSTKWVPKAIHSRCHVSLRRSLCFLCVNLFLQSTCRLVTNLWCFFTSTWRDLISQTSWISTEHNFQFSFPLLQTLLQNSMHTAVSTLIYCWPYSPEEEGSVEGGSNTTGTAV